jgi:hypothetical protein
LKRLVSWHEECLRNAKSSEEGIRKQIAWLSEDLKRLENSNLLHETQIIEAKKRGLTEFDSERLLKKRVKTIGS